MATPEAQEAAAKDRIIKHMNADHQDSVRRYVEKDAGASPFQVRNAQMTDISLNEMKITYAGRQAVVSFDPPMKSLREARERLVRMDKDALQALGRSDITITRYIPPYIHPLHMLVFGASFLTFLAFSRTANFRQGSLLHDLLLYRFPGFTNFCLTIHPLVLGGMLSIHGFESWLMIKKVEKHGLLVFSFLWCCWVGSCFIEGFTSFRRLNGLIEEKKKEKEGKKH